MSWRNGLRCNSKIRKQSGLAPKFIKLSDSQDWSKNKAIIRV